MSRDTSDEDVALRARLYRTAAWQKLRRAVLKRSPLCEQCMKQGIRRNATVADHTRGHGYGWQMRFWYGPFTALCESCHGKKTAIERPVSGFRAGLASTGQPVIGFGGRINHRGGGSKLGSSERLRPPALPDVRQPPENGFFPGSTTGATHDDSKESS